MLLLFWVVLLELLNRVKEEPKLKVVVIKTPKTTMHPPMLMVIVFMPGIVYWHYNGAVHCPGGLAGAD